METEKKAENQQTKPTQTSTETSQTKPKAKKKRKKIKYLPDDGHTIYSMDGLNNTRHKSDKESVQLEKGEKWELIKAALSVYLPIFIGVVLCFTAVAILLYFWLK